MDRSNFENVTKLARNPSDIAKVKLILETDNGIEKPEVPDPYYGDMSDFKHVFELLDSACTTIANSLLEKDV